MKLLEASPPAHSKTTSVPPGAEVDKVVGLYEARYFPRKSP